MYYFYFQKSFIRLFVINVVNIRKYIEIVCYEVFRKLISHSMFYSTYDKHGRKNQINQGLNAKCSWIHLKPIAVNLMIFLLENLKPMLLKKWIQFNKLPIKSYRKNKNSSSFSDWYDIIRDVPLGSILGPLFFSLLLISIFLSKEQVHAFLPMIIQYITDINL